MERKKKERKREDRSQAEERKNCAGQSSHMTTPRTRNVSRECTPNHLKRKTNCVIHTPDTSQKTVVRNSPRNKRCNSKQTNLKETLDFRSGRRIRYTSSPKSLDESNIIEVSKSVDKSSADYTDSSNCSLGITIRSGRQLSHPLSPKLRTEFPDILRKSVSGITANKSPQLRKTPGKQQSRQRENSTQKPNTKVTDSPEISSPGIHFRSRRRIFYSPNQKCNSLDHSKALRSYQTLSSSPKIQETPSKSNCSKPKSTREDKLTPHEKESTESSPGLLFRSGRRVDYSPSFSLSKESRGFKTPTKRLLKGHTPSKLIEIKKGHRNSTPETPRASPVTRSCSKNSSISTGIPLKHESGSGKLKEERNYCHTLQSSKRGLNICNTKKQKLKTKERFKRRLSDEEPFIRRKKLRSEVKDDELWEGFLPIRFKRLTPKKGVSMENEKSQKTKRNSRDGQDLVSSSNDGYQRRCFADLYNEFLMKSESFSKYQQRALQKNIKGSISNDEVNKDENISKEMSISSNSTSDLTLHSKQKGVSDIQEILPKFKEECEAIKKRKGVQDERYSEPMRIDDKCKGGSISIISNNIKSVDSSVITPKRSARLQEKQSSGKIRKSYTSKAVPACQQDSSSKRKRSARALLLESTDLNISSENTEYYDSGEKIHEMTLANVSKHSANKNKASAESTQSIERDIHSTADVDKNQPNETIEQRKDLEWQKEIKTNPKNKTKMLQTGQVTLGMATRRTPNRNKVEQCCTGELKSEKDYRKTQDDETSETCKNCDVHVTKEQRKAKTPSGGNNVGQDQDKEKHTELELSACDTEENEEMKTNLEQLESSQVHKPQRSVPTPERKRKVGDEKMQMVNSSHSTEFSNNALTKTERSVTNVCQNNIENSTTSSQTNEKDGAEEAKQYTRYNQHEENDSNKIDMAKSSIDEHETKTSGDLQLDIITDLLQMIVNRVEGSVNIKNVELVEQCRPKESHQLSTLETLSEILKHTDEECLVSSVRTEHSGNVQVRRTNSGSFSSQTEEADAKHEPLKIVVRKTDQGAKIVKQSPQLSRLKQTPEQISATTTENGHLENLHDIVTICKKGSPALHKHTRSKTRSGEGETACILDDPDIELRPSRNKVKHSRQMKASISEDISNNTLSSSTASTPTRNSAADIALLQNQTIGKHASVLWSSENRRHFQLTCQGQDSSGVEEIMRKAWEALGTKERLKYYQRAQSATRDENRHSLPKKKKDQASKEDISSDSKMKCFLKLKRSEQHSEIVQNLKSIYGKSKETYIRIMREFKIESQRAKERESNKTDMQGVYHKLLYQIILDARETIRQIECQQRDQERIAVQEELSEITRKLIVGEGVSFSKHTRSETLAELLLDLNDLEKNSRVSVNGEPIVCSEYKLILDDLLGCEFEFADCSILDDLPQENSCVSTEILSQIHQENLPDLDVTDEYLLPINTSTENICQERMELISSEFNKITSQSFRENQHCNPSNCCELNSPSCFLNNWLVADQFHRLSQGSARDEQILIDPTLLAPILRPLKRRKTQEKYLPRDSQATKGQNSNNFSDMYLQAVPTVYQYPYDLVTFSRSANVISSIVNHGGIRYIHAKRNTKDDNQLSN